MGGFGLKHKPCQKLRKLRLELLIACFNAKTAIANPWLQTRMWLGVNVVAVCQQSKGGHVA